MINKTKMKVKSKAFMNVVKSTLETFNQNYTEQEEVAKKQLEETRLHMENELKNNDAIISSLKFQKEKVTIQINDHQPALQKQDEILRFEEKKMYDLIIIKENLDEEANELQKQIDLLIQKQTKINNETVRMFDELKKIERMEPKKEVMASEPFAINKNAESMKLQLHGLTCQFGEETRLKEVVSFNTEVIQFKYEHIVKGKVEDVYFFKTSSDLEKEKVFMYRQVEGQLLPIKIATGTIFLEAEQNENQGEVNNVTMNAMKFLYSMEQALEKRYY